MTGRENPGYEEGIVLYLSPVLNPMSYDGYEEGGGEVSSDYGRGSSRVESPSH